MIRHKDGSLTLHVESEGFEEARFKEQRWTVAERFSGRYGEYVVMRPPSPAVKALNTSYTVAEFVAYLHRVGYHEIADRVLDDRQIIVIGEDQ